MLSNMAVWDAASRYINLKTLITAFLILKNQYRTFTFMCIILVFVCIFMNLQTCF